MNAVFSRDDIDGHLIRSMATAVLEQGVLDYYALVKSENRLRTIYSVLQEQPGDSIDFATQCVLSRLRETIAETRDTGAWIESDSNELNSFAWCCNVCDLDVEQTRQEAFDRDSALRRRLASRSEALRAQAVPTEEAATDSFACLRAPEPLQCELAL